MITPPTRTARFTVALPQVVLLSVVASMIACGSERGAPTAPAAAGVVTPAPPTPENRAPVVSVRFDSATSCVPHGSYSCDLGVTALASDPDGDGLSYAWSGCARGNAATAVCRVSDPGPVTATVTVDDGHGHTAMASVAGRGDEVPNSPPAVSIAFPSGSSCTPKPGVPCTVGVVAQVVDPDGDPITYAWSGCAAGSGSTATCVIAAPGTVAVSVVVEDGHGHAVPAGASVLGINHSPDVQIGSIAPPRPESGEIDILGNVIDRDDGFLCGAEYCGIATASGACGATPVFRCSCLAGLEVWLTRTTPTGICAVTLEVKDKWGAVGRPTITFDVQTFKVLSHTSVRPMGARD